MASAPLQSAPTLRPSDVGEPAWEVAKLFPNQGHWSEGDYLQLNGNYLVELADGRIDVLPMPTEEHQALVAFLFEMLLTFVRPAKLGTVRFAPLRMRVGRIVKPIGAEQVVTGQNLDVEYGVAVPCQCEPRIPLAFEPFVKGIAHGVRIRVEENGQDRSHRFSFRRTASLAH